VSQVLSATMEDTYPADGYEIVANVLGPADFEPLVREFLGAAEALTGQTFESMHDPALCQILKSDLALESRLYDLTKSMPSLRELAFHPKLVRAVAAHMPGPFGVLGKAVLRIDLPGHEAEVAHWHQDSFYVRGNDQTITAWIPLQNVVPLNGCLEIAPGSHTMGAVDHPRMIGKRYVPSEEVLALITRQDAEMAFGGALVFHANLLHQGRLNQSDAIRYSVQYRYSPLGLPTDPGMGELIPVQIDKD
jgi:hypothetical protein